MIKTVLIDKDLRYRHHLGRKLLRDYPSAIELVAEARGIQHGLRVIEQHRPQLVFLEFRLLDGNGFELLDHFESIPFQFIFTSYFAKYAIPALRYGALDYLLKPLNAKELQGAINRMAQLVPKLRPGPGHCQGPPRPGTLSKYFCRAKKSVRSSSWINWYASRQMVGIPSFI